MVVCSERAGGMHLMRERGRNWLVVTALVVSAGVALIAYPHLLGALLQRFGVRAVAAGLLAMAVVSLALPLRPVRQKFASTAVPALGFPALLLAAIASGDVLYLRLLPALVYATLSCVFWASMRGGDSVIELVARLMVPEAPAFIRPYCRVVTGLWGGFFFASAALIAALALARQPAWWRGYTGGLIYALMLGISVVEFLTRKTWFRYYYHGGPFDQLWSRLFPAEATPRGRASLAYIEWHREHQAEHEAGTRTRR
jgi:uncharacterized membrane protein